MQTRSKSQRTERAVRRDADIVCLGHGGNLFRLGNTAGVGNVGLDNVDAAEFKVWANVFARKEAFSKLTVSQVYR